MLQALPTFKKLEVDSAVNFLQKVVKCDFGVGNALQNETIHINVVTKNENYHIKSHF